jgi:hypothetical protein
MALPYVTPTLKKLDPTAAALKLTEAANEGNEEAMLMLEALNNRLLQQEAVHMRYFRWGMLLLVSLTVAFSILAWHNVQTIGINLDAVPVGASVLVCLFVACVMTQARELRHLRRSLLQGAETPAEVTSTP